MRIVLMLHSVTKSHLSNIRQLYYNSPIQRHPITKGVLQMQKTIFLILALTMQIATVSLVVQTTIIGQALLLTVFFGVVGTTSAVVLTVTALTTNWD